MKVKPGDITYRWSRGTILPTDQEIRNHKNQLLVCYKAEEDSSGNLRWMYAYTIKVSDYSNQSTKENFRIISIGYAHPCGSIHYQSID